MGKSTNKYKVYNNELSYSFIKSLLTSVLLVIAIISLFVLHYYGLIFIGLFLIFNSFRTGAIFDFDNKKYKRIFSIGFIPFGTWNDLSNIGHYRLSQKFESNSFASRGSSSNLSEMVYILRIFEQNNKDYFKVSTSKKKAIDSIKANLEQLGVERERKA